MPFGNLRTTRSVHAPEVLREVGQAFCPNTRPRPVIAHMLVSFQLGIALLLWMVSPFKVLPQPEEVFHAFGRLWADQGLGHELFVSFQTNLEALAISSVLSLGCAYLTVVPFCRPLVAAISRGRFLSLAGFTFVFTLLFGGGHPLKVSLLVFGMTVFFVTSMATVVSEIPQETFDHARTLRMGEWRTVWEVVVLGTLGQAWEVTRQNAAIGWMMLTMVEGISRAEGGVGVLLLNQSKHFHLPEIFAIQIAILGMGLLQDSGLRGLRRLCCPWADLTLERK
jgi:NitT/TauT family transport system permease protein